MPAMSEPDRAPSRRTFTALVIAEAVALTAGAAAMIVYDLGIAGAIAMAVLVAVFTYTLFRAGERRAIESGSFSPAMGRYNRRMLTAGAIYVVGLFAAIWAHDELHPDGLSPSPSRFCRRSASYGWSGPWHVCLRKRRTNIFATGWSARRCSASAPC